ncbi:linoleate 9S-lipoxygenase-like [Prosopis cineraria]|uniref:linoleate 9S-lipoxygenase-like n=1 Tax=Prosopis cineraria TaxID=364024 RepID=UPI00240F3584|nr:linoleate 9S-lipoxygenase-like [Prosopis cineraria]
MAGEEKYFTIKGTLVIINLNVTADSQSFTIELISSGSNPILSESGMLKVENSASSEGIKQEDGASTYIVYFNWRHEMGIPGAFIMRNLHPTDQFFLVSFTIEIPNHSAPIDFVCRSWVYPDTKYKSPRIFFVNKPFLPSETPEGLLPYRKQELEAIRGDGTGERKEWDRIYDYATYNDLGNIDKSEDLARPVLGGSTQYPYPRRVRTGRPPSNKDPNSESRLGDDQAFTIYVPRDDRFGNQKLFEFVQYFPKSSMNLVKSYLLKELESKEKEFGSFKSVFEVLYENGFTFNVPKLLLDTIAQRLPIPEPPADGNLLLKFPIPTVIQDNLDGWMTDEEFTREMLAGVNPGLIRLLEVFPIECTLDRNIYGDHSSMITREHLEKNMQGCTIEEALNCKRFFILDHYDAFMPYLRKINESSTRKAYASRTVLFLQNDGTLKPLAIELSLPHPDGDQFGAVSKVYLPESEGVEAALWQLAKAYVVVNDSGYHQLVSHWLNTHAVMEPFVIATHRCLSALHPIHKLVHPHFHDTLFINALARQNLISADGTIETAFLPAKYSMEMSSVVYENWNFLEQALPADLIKRGMATEDKDSPHGLCLVIKDYPYAADGLDIWDAINKWVCDYVFLYYNTDHAIKHDTELQAWWKEVVQVGHADLKDKPWWPKMETREELIESCTIIIWIASALHAAVNFGQFPYGGYILNRPTLSRRLIPEKGTAEYEELKKNPEQSFLKTITPKFETLLDLSIIEILSGHTSDEVYLGTTSNPTWTSDEMALESFNAFGKKLKEIEETIEKRNKDPELLNRVGPVNVPYTLLYPSSEPGMTGKGIPNSISI